MHFLHTKVQYTFFREKKVAKPTIEGGSPAHLLPNTTSGFLACGVVVLLFLPAVYQARIAIIATMPPASDDSASEDANGAGGDMSSGAEEDCRDDGKKSVKRSKESRKKRHDKDDEKRSKKKKHHHHHHKDHRDSGHKEHRGNKEGAKKHKKEKGKDDKHGKKKDKAKKVVVHRSSSEDESDSDDSDTGIAGVDSSGSSKDACTSVPTPPSVAKSDGAEKTRTLVAAGTSAAEAGAGESKKGKKQSSSSSSPPPCATAEAGAGESKKGKKNSDKHDDIASESSTAEHHKKHQQQKPQKPAAPSSDASLQSSSKSLPLDPAPTAPKNPRKGGGSSSEGGHAQLSQASAEPLPPVKKQRQNPHPKKDGFLSKQGALAILSACQLTKSEFNDFFCATAFDSLSGGMYRKFLVQSRAAKESWAFDVQSAICKVQKLVKMVTCVVATVRSVEERGRPSAMPSEPLLGRGGFSSVLLACMNSSSPPCKKTVQNVKLAVAKHRASVDHHHNHHHHHHNQHARSTDDDAVPPNTAVAYMPVCCVTGVLLEDECIEIRGIVRSGATVGSSHSSSGARGQSKQRGVQKKEGVDPGSASVEEDAVRVHESSDVRATTIAPPVAQMPLIVHPDLHHFFHVFWFCSKIEHIVRHFSRCWMDQHQQQPSAPPIPPSKNGGGSGGRGGKGSASFAVKEGDNENSGKDNARDGNVLSDASSSSSDSDEDDDDNDNDGDDGDCSSDVKKTGAAKGDSAKVAGSSADAVEEDINVKAMCERFAKENEEAIESMHSAFMYGYAHIIESIYSHPCMVQSVSAAENATFQPSKKGLPGGDNRGKGGSDEEEDDGDDGDGDIVLMESESQPAAVAQGGGACKEDDGNDDDDGSVPSTKARKRKTPGSDSCKRKKKAKKQQDSSKSKGGMNLDGELDKGDCEDDNEDEDD